MGKYIYCAGKMAAHPFIFPVTGVRVFSIEELSYYLYETIDSVTRELFDDALIDWVDGGLGLPETAAKLRGLKKGRHELKDYVVAVLCACDYYDEEEIKYLIRTMDKLERMSPLEKWKRKADNFLKYQDYVHAGKEYEAILEGIQDKKPGSAYVSQILHNLGITRLHTASYLAAAETFLQAYQKSGVEASRKAYLMALYLGREEQGFAEALSVFQMDEEGAREVIDTIEEAMLKAESTEVYQRIKRVEEVRRAGGMEEYQLRTSALLNQWKEEYRNGVI